MSTYTNLNNDPQILKTKAKVYEIKNFKYQTEKHDHVRNYIKISWNRQWVLQKKVQKFK